MSMFVGVVVGSGPAPPYVTPGTPSYELMDYNPVASVRA
jgi:hypothetical protein